MGQEQETRKNGIAQWIDSHVAVVVLVVAVVALAPFTITLIPKE